MLDRSDKSFEKGKDDMEKHAKESRHRANTVTARLGKRHAVDAPVYSAADTKWAVNNADIEML